MYRITNRLSRLPLACVLLLAACSSYEEPATKQIAAIESAIESAQPDAGRYVPDNLASVQERLATIKASFARKDYGAVVGAAPALLTDAQQLLGAAAMKKAQVVDELKRQWPALADSLPQWLEGLQKRVDALTKLHKAPAGVDLAGARAALGEARALWGKANSAFSAGNLEEAVQTATTVKEKATAAAAALKMPLPA